VKKKEMKKAKTKLTGVLAIAMALTIAFSGVALASHPVPPTKETEILDITTNIKCNGSVVESQRLSLEIDSGNLLDNPPLAAGEKYGKIGYNEKMIASNGSTEFNKSFNVDTGTTPNLNVTKNIGYQSGALGSLSHAEAVGMKVIARGKPAVPGGKTCTGSANHAEWKQKICPFQTCEPDPNTPAVPGCHEEVNAYSTIVATDVQADTHTEVGITGVSGAPVTLNYNIDAVGTGFVSAGVDLYVEDGRGADGLGSRMSYKEKAIGYGKSVDFTKNIGYTSIFSP
jgi:hypothetical protein